MFKRKMAAVALSLGMVFTMGSTAFAANATATKADEAYLVKYLRLADGVTNPNVAFTFEFAAKDGAPAIADQTITPATESQSEKDGASVVGSLKLNDVFKGKFNHAGTYHYTVTEKATAEGFKNGEKETTVDGVTTTEKITFSDEKYTVEVRIANTKDENGNDTLGDPEVTIQKDGDKDKTNATDEDPTVTPGKDGGEDVDNTENGTATEIPGFSFTNTYEKTTSKPVEPKPEDPENGKYGAAGITKKVVGNYADKTFAFPFTLTMNAGTGVTATTATAKLITGTDVKNAETVEIKFGEAKNFNLKHGQSLVFETLPAGVTYTVTENLKDCGVKDESSYTASINKTKGEKGASLTSDEITVSDNEDAENDGHFTNTVDDDDVTPTGIVLNNLPYVLLIGLAFGGILMVARKRRYE